ncbi:PASTA domain-containing protein [Salinibacter altiplanensis]|uniref:PASTA domain-containing protein n=1 Tax=Salinibacter altiplanensis TaxID=1803181 RepID=UPI000C9FDF8D|nr:PASTA domain-containing protein [Salinibacter altiplanensis]
MPFSSVVQNLLGWLRTLLRNTYFWGGLGGLLVLGVAAYVLVDALLMPSYTRHGVSVQVPDVERQSFLTAKERVENHALQVKRQVGRFNPNVPRETVVDQNPPPRSDVKPGRRVYLTVNAGEAPVVNIPDLNGISVREAKNQVASLGLNVGGVEPDSLPSPYPNTITRQRPRPGDSLKTGGTIDLWYSTGLGTDSVQVPGVAGRTVEQARRRLRAQKLRAIVVAPRTPDTPNSDAQPADTSSPQRFIQRQGRPPETKVRAGTEIRLFATDDSTAVPEPASASPDTAAAN